MTLSVPTPGFPSYHLKAQYKELLEGFLFGVLTDGSGIGMLSLGFHADLLFPVTCVRYGQIEVAGR